MLFFTEPLGQSEVGHVWLAVRVEQDVCRFEVAMQDAALVGVVNGAGQFGHKIYDV